MTGGKFMNITDVRIRLVAKDDSKLRAVASVTIDECIAIHDIKIIDGNDGYFVSMPARKNSKGEYKDIVHPINNEARAEMIDAIMEAYKTELAKEEA